MKSVQSAAVTTTRTTTEGMAPSDAELAALLPACAVRVVTLLEGAGFEAWVVGGWVRDALLASPVHERHLFSGLQNRATELLNDTKDLRDYIFQIRSGYQRHINVRQNNVMSILTIVTTIATPIALITGWYGMASSTTVAKL